MGGFNDEMLTLVDHSFLAACIPAPEDKYQMWAVVIEIFDDVLGKCFPAFAAMATGEVGLNGESVIEKHDALLSPACKIAVIRNWRADVVVDFFKDIHE